MDVVNAAQSASEVALSIDQITGWVIKIIIALAGTIITLSTVIAYLFREFRANQKVWYETQLQMQRDTNQIINDNTNALNDLSEGLKAIPDHIETLLRLHLAEKK